MSLPDARMFIAQLKAVNAIARLLMIATTAERERDMGGWRSNYEEEARMVQADFDEAVAELEGLVHAITENTP